MNISTVARNTRLSLAALIMSGCFLQSCSHGPLITESTASKRFQQVYATFEVKDYVTSKNLILQFLADTAGLEYECFPILAECYRQIGQTDSARYVYEAAIQKVNAKPTLYLENAPAELTKWSNDFPSFPSELQRKNGFTFTSIEPTILERVSPEYPATGLAEGIEGGVVLKILIDEDGNPLKVVVTKSLRPDFDQAATNVAKRTRFSPATRFGRPAKSWVTFPVRFKLNR